MNDTSHLNLRSGDSVYYRHSENGHIQYGNVVAIGKHGITVDADDGKEHKVRWDAFLGRRKRAERHLTIIDQGEDGALLEDEKGKRFFVRGKIDDQFGKALHLSPPLLIDIAPLSCDQSDLALEALHKSFSEDKDIWRPHESIYIRKLIEDITGQGRKALDGLSADLLRWLDHAGRQNHPAPLSLFHSIQPWEPSRAEKVLSYLRGKQIALWIAADYMLLIDYLVHVHLPSTLPEKISRLAVYQAAIMGHISSVKKSISQKQVETLLQHFGQSDKSLSAALTLAKIDTHVLEYGAVQAMNQVAAFTDKTRHRLKNIILEHIKLLQIGNQASGSLQTKLFDEFGAFNRDWRRIALTETGEMANQGFICALKPGDKVKRLEQYKGACAFCRKIDGAEATIVSADKPDKDWDKEIWPGKNNIGRSASPYKRSGNTLVKRGKDELWKLPAGLAHPHCRGTWIRIAGPVADDDFTKWLNQFLSQATGVFSGEPDRALAD